MLGHRHQAAAVVAKVNHELCRAAGAKLRKRRIEGRYGRLDEIPEVEVADATTANVENASQRHRRDRHYLLDQPYAQTFAARLANQELARHAGFGGAERTDQTLRK